MANLVGSGWAYDAYEIEEEPNKVFKKLKSKLKIIRKFIIYGPRMFPKYFSYMKNSNNSVNFFIKNQDKIDTTIIGNPKFNEDGSYTQDRAMLLGNFFEGHPINVNKQIIDKYIENIFEQWRNGFSSTLFNFTINNGINNDGELILFDLNEITESKKEVEEFILSKKWLNNWSYRKLKEIRLKNYFKEQMEKRVTVNNLNKYWKDIK